LEFFDTDIFTFINNQVDLYQIDRKSAVLLSTDNMFNIQTIDNKQVTLLINLHKLNDVRWFNRYFLEVHGKLAKGGHFIGKVHTIATHRKYFLCWARPHKGLW